MPEKHVIHIQNMSPGRELDATIQYEVFGDMPTWFYTGLDRGKQPYYKVTVLESPLSPGYGSCTPGFDMDNNPVYFKGVQVPGYSTFILQAWKVVEHFPNYSLWQNEKDDLHRAEFLRVSGSWGKYAAAGLTAPHAICLAALRAVREEGKY